MKIILSGRSSSMTNGLLSAYSFKLPAGKESIADYGQEKRYQDSKNQ